MKRGWGRTNCDSRGADRCCRSGGRGFWHHVFVVRIHELEIATVESSRVGRVHDHREIAEERDISRGGRQVVVDVLGEEGLVGNSNDGPVLATQVTQLASGRLAGIAQRLLATVIGVEMGQGFSAVAIRWHWFRVDVVDWAVSMWLRGELQ